ncbi:pesticin immunity protein [Salmonella enterica subsp. enterica serovar Choleraesuis]|nr:pesticin immunity protein [Salmonella enterica subsp. enterica serovar Choleraesuis]
MISISKTLLATVITFISSTALANTLPSEILNNLNLHSFHNSLRPRGAIDGDTVKKFGFDVQKDEQNKNYYSVTDKEQSWTYSVKVLKQHNDKYYVCFYDFATPPATYRGIQEIIVIKDEKRNLYQVVKTLDTTKGC